MRQRTRLHLAREALEEYRKIQPDCETLGASAPPLHAVRDLCIAAKDTDAAEKRPRDDKKRPSPCENFGFCARPCAVDPFAGACCQFRPRRPRRMGLPSCRAGHWGIGRDGWLSWPLDRLASGS